MTENSEIPQNPKAQEISGLVPVLGRVKASKRGRTENRGCGLGWGLKAKCAITHTLVRKRERLCHGAKTAARSSFRKMMWRSWT